MRFAVPQFIDIEDKVFGPFTFKQFIYLAGGAGIVFVLFRVLPTIVAILIGLPVAGLAGALTFLKINNKPFAQILESAVKYFLSNKLYLWKKKPPKKSSVAKAAEGKKAEEVKYIPQLSESKLKDIAWGLNVRDMKEKGE